MELSRRDFLKLSLVPAVSLPFLGTLTGSQESLAKSTGIRMGEKALLYDATKCINCHVCEVTCKNKNNLPEGILLNRVTSSTANINGQNQTVYFKQQCRHCTEATCVEVCPTGAVSHHALGFVAFDQDKCSGCGYCARYCPFKVPQLVGNNLGTRQKMFKCDFCIDRVTNNQPTACAEMCPQQALVFGDRAELITQGQERLTQLKNTYPEAELYGETQLGGLHFLSIIPGPALLYGMSETPQVPASANVHNLAKVVGTGLGGLTLVGLGLNYLVARQTKSKHEAKE